MSITSSHNSKGTAVGVYAASQFIGIFTGGLIGGIIHEYFGLPAVFIFGGIMSFAWLLITLLPIKNSAQLLNAELNGQEQSRGK
jgi:MFS family permease